MDARRHRWRRDADSRARLHALSIIACIIVLTRIAIHVHVAIDIFRWVYAVKRTKIFDPASSGWNDSWRTLNWLARNCLGFWFYLGLTNCKQEVLGMLSRASARALQSGNFHEVCHATGFHEPPHKEVLVDWPLKQACAPMEQRASHHCQRARGHGRTNPSCTSTWVPGNRAGL